ncbi:hypothetical protein HY992_01150 [Candidatus Micrarchaeota archaeon]|nr:hypothetical protein [Candidatus Micrarchaeota archaeon]
MGNGVVANGSLRLSQPRASVLSTQAVFFRFLRASGSANSIARQLAEHYASLAEEHGLKTLQKAEFHAKSAVRFKQIGEHEPAAHHFSEAAFLSRQCSMPKRAAMLFLLAASEYEFVASDHKKSKSSAREAHLKAAQCNLSAGRLKN